MKLVMLFCGAAQPVMRRRASVLTNGDAGVRKAIPQPAIDCGVSRGRSVGRESGSGAILLPLVAQRAHLAAQATEFLAFIRGYGVARTTVDLKSEACRTQFQSVWSATPSKLNQDYERIFFHYEEIRPCRI